MIDEDYQKIVEKNMPKEKRTWHLLKAFIIGGLVGSLGEIMVLFYEYIFHLSRTNSQVLMIITLIFFASLFTALGFFDTWVNFARCGLLIPITGFAHSVTSASLEYKNEGPIYGIGSNTFKLAGSVIVYGVVSSWLFGIIRYLIGGFLL